MAVRKQEFDNNEDHTTQTNKRTRITIDVSPEMRKRIKVAAAQHDLSISDYLVRILEHTVPDEASLTQQQARPVTREMLERVYQARALIMEHTNGRVFDDSVEIIRQMREERSRELDQL